jgi:hypothetical protein
MSERDRRETVAGWAETAVREAEAEAQAAGAAPAAYPVGKEHPDKEQQVLDRIDKARRRRAKLKEERITLAHGAGGKATHTLIEALFLDAFRNPLLEELGDQAVFTAGGARLAFTTDSFVVSPLFFPGGDIGNSRSTGPSTTWPCPAPGRCTCRPASSWRKASPSRTSGASHHPWRVPRRRPGSRLSPATPRSCSGARPTAVTSTPPASALSSTA